MCSRYHTLLGWLIHCLACSIQSLIYNNCMPTMICDEAIPTMTFPGRTLRKCFSRIACLRNHVAQQSSGEREMTFPIEWVAWRDGDIALDATLFMIY